MSINLTPPVLLKTHREAIEQGAREGGKEPRLSEWRVAREVFVAETSEEARRIATEGVLARDFNDYFLKLLIRVLTILNYF